MPQADPVLRWHVLSVPKHGHTDDEYEDAWAADPASGRFAVADGATESSFAALWARLLAEAFLTASTPADSSAWLDEPRRRWAAEVMGLELPWFAEMKRDQGAFATLLGLSIRLPVGGRPGVWRTEAVGDTCLVRVRKNRFVRAFPLKKSADFGNQPHLIGSLASPPPALERASGSLVVGDQLFMMTDALAHWFLRTNERRGRPWEVVADLLMAEQPQEDFAALVEGLREGGALHNDDVTLIAIAIEEGSAAEE
jgi:hypothetical protein